MDVTCAARGHAARGQVFLLEFSLSGFRSACSEIQEERPDNHLGRPPQEVHWIEFVTSKRSPKTKRGDRDDILLRNRLALQQQRSGGD